MSKRIVVFELSSCTPTCPHFDGPGLSERPLCVYDKDDPKPIIYEDFRLFPETCELPDTEGG